MFQTFNVMNASKPMRGFTSVAQDAELYCITINFYVQTGHLLISGHEILSFIVF